ncbi:SMI1/KNR4 family protein [Shouchella sp. 1P09AA]|uniref:SMI1/KNR4 family protein n=1 Tax=unclassified Shouchella TaxID=2893065 RepID=UPI00399FCBBF
MVNLFKDMVMDPYQLEEVKSDDFTIVENKIGLKLPQSYKNLMMLQNGGSLNKNKITIDQNTITINYLMGASKDSDEGILQSEYFKNEWGLPDNIVLLSGEGEIWIALDYRKSMNPVVTYFDVETEEDFILADNFEDFIENLYGNSENDQINLDDIIFEGDKTHFSVEEAEEAFEHGTISDKSFALIQYANDLNTDTNWLLVQINTVINTKGDFNEGIISEAAEELYKTINKANSEIIAKDKTITDSISIMKNHRDYEIQKYAEKIEQLHIQKK